MNDNKKNIPVPDPDLQGLEYTCPAASWGDMTGLIPYSADTPSDRLSYNEIYPYLPEYSANHSDYHGF